jgi:hypothetical protein
MYMQMHIRSLESQKGNPFCGEQTRSGIVGVTPNPFPVHEIQLTLTSVPTLTLLYIP